MSAIAARQTIELERDPAHIDFQEIRPFPGAGVVTATGRGSYARTAPDRFGFPRLARARRKRHHGFATGDLLRASVPKGKWAGTWTGRISVRASGKHGLSTPVGRCTVSHRNLRLLQRADGYAYSYRQEVTE
ncbi:hypothetical protein ACFVW9_03850 [Streptomyces sp. NPDC058217]|uniref:hypothetical protein n=1 Tax=Streptomyces sp. NPDC058217 TaxID=3346384 RepID=UPI0036E30FC2